MSLDAFTRHKRNNCRPTNIKGCIVCLRDTIGRETNDRSRFNPSSGSPSSYNNKQFLNYVSVNREESAHITSIDVTYEYVIVEHVLHDTESKTNFLLFRSAFTTPINV